MIPLMVMRKTVYIRERRSRIFLMIGYDRSPMPERMIFHQKIKTRKTCSLGKHENYDFIFEYTRSSPFSSDFIILLILTNLLLSESMESGD